MQPLFGRPFIFGFDALKVIGIQQVQFFDCQFKPERITSCRSALGFLIQQPLNHVRMDFPVIATTDCSYDLFRFDPREWLQRDLLDTRSLFQSLGRRPWNCGRNHAGILRPQFWPPC